MLKTSFQREHPLISLAAQGSTLFLSLLGSKTRFLQTWEYRTAADRTEKHGCLALSITGSTESMGENQAVRSITEAATVILSMQ
jgi:hypothetical protein